jgi:hypothetical protein
VIVRSQSVGTGPVPTSTTNDSGIARSDFVHRLKMEGK